MKKAVVVGSGAGGATVAKDLQGIFDVTVLEAGNAFSRFKGNLSFFEKIKNSGILFNEKMIQAVFPPMRVLRGDDGLVIIKGAGFGGTTPLSAGNGMRRDESLKTLGIDLDDEFEEISNEIPQYLDHQKIWHKTTLEAFKACDELGLDPEISPKLIYKEKCIGCGRCILGCPKGAKWDSRRYLSNALENGAKLFPQNRVEKVVIEGKKATGVLCRDGLKLKFFPADLIVLAAGGLGTPLILKKSGIECEDRLFVDPVLCLAARIEGCEQNLEIPMPFFVQTEHFMISPYFDFLSFFFNGKWSTPGRDIFSLMIKLGDENRGSISPKGINKALSETDLKRIKEALEICKDIFSKMGKKESELFLGNLNAGHPGGMLPLTEREAETLHSDRLPLNLYVADSTLFPSSLGGPQILTIVALAKRISKECKNLA